MSTIYKGFLIAMETMVFTFIIILLYITADRSADTEKAVNGVVEKKINISSTYVDYESKNLYTDSNEDANLLYISGGAVITEILSYDDSITVRVNNVELNRYMTETGEPFFDYIRKYGLPGDIAGSISVTRQYQKNCFTDNKGNLAKVEYILQ